MGYPAVFCLLASAWQIAIPSESLYNIILMKKATIRGEDCAGYQIGA